MDDRSAGEFSHPPQSVKLPELPHWYRPTHCWSSNCNFWGQVLSTYYRQWNGLLADFCRLDIQMSIFEVRPKEMAFFLTYKKNLTKKPLHLSPYTPRHMCYQFRGPSMR